MNEQKPLQNNYRKKQRKAVLKLVALLLVAATLFATSAWSWFRSADNQKATANGLVLKSADDTLEMSICVNGVYSAYSNTINITNFLSNLSMTPVTGSGKLLSSANKVELLIPALTYDNEGNASVDGKSAWTYAVANKDYIEIKVKFRSKVPVTIYLAEGTGVDMLTERNGKDLFGPNAGNISRYGDFTRDGMVGALRMTAARIYYNTVTHTERELHKFTWIPRPEIILSKDSNGTYNLSNQFSYGSLWSGIHSFYTASKVPDSDVNCFQTKDVFTANREDVESLTEKTIIGRGREMPKEDDEDYKEAKEEYYEEIGGEQYSVCLKETMEGVDYYVCSAVFRIWVEGTDAEALRALSNGQFYLTLNVLGIED
jgi:archaellum component FlaF (FlaF/FlaG flagellin family)